MRDREIGSGLASPLPNWNPWVAAGYLAAALVLAPVRGFPLGPWAVFGDDGVWLSIVRGWCDGARLYLDLWENKGPLYFLLLRPACLVPAPSDLTIGAEMLLVGVPLHLASAAAFALLGAQYALGRVAAVALGAASLLALWSGLSGGYGLYMEFFATESFAVPFAAAALALWLRNQRTGERWTTAALALAVFAALLVNWKFAVYGALYFGLRGLGARRFAQDALLCVGLALAVLLITLGFEAASYRFMLEAFHLGPDVYPTLAQRIRTVVADHWILGRNSGIVGVLRSPFYDWLPRGARPFWEFGALLMAVSLLFSALRSQRRLIVPVLVIWLGTVSERLFAHTFVQLLPVLLLGVAAFLASAPGRKHAWRTATVVAYLALALVSECLIPRSRYTLAASEPSVRASRELARSWAGYLAGRRWVSLAGNGSPMLLAPGVRRPENRAFHSYCLFLPEWAEADVRAAVERGGVRVALQSALGSPRCRTRAVAELVRRECAFVGTVTDPVPWMGPVEFRDCPATAPGDAADR